jgi:glutathione synthase/RimK-type ligase-like ATP-grasp enzyme
VILVIASEQDEHAMAVLERLGRDGAPATLLDLSRFPQTLQLSMSYGCGGGRDFRLLTAVGDIPLSACQVIWWRRPQPFELHPQVINPSYRSFAYNECLEAFSGLWLALDAFWVNHPARDQEASHKPYQLKLAQEVGLEIPDTLITNSPEAARAFAERHGTEKTIYKSFSATEHHWRETRLLKSEELALLDRVRFAPVTFQEYVPAGLDLRVTMVGPDVFAAAIHSQESSYKVDYRMDMATSPVEPFELPTYVVERLHALMERLGLVYGAIDMRLTPDGRYVFLEINTAGQWLFVEERTRQPITATFARLLSSRQERRDRQEV